METNDILIFTNAVVSGSRHHAQAIIDWNPLAQIEWIAIVVVCATVVWMAVCNHRTLLSSRQLTPEAVKTLDSRIAISQYMLMILTAVWFLALTAAARFIVETVLLCEGKPMAAAQKCMVSLNAQPPLTIAYLLVTLTALHGTIGIALVLRKRNRMQDSQP